MDAGFLSVVEDGQYFMTKDTGDLKQFNTVACREYTLPREEATSQPKGWIQAKTLKLGGGQAGRWEQNRRGQQARRRASNWSGRATQRPRRRRQSRENRAGTGRAGGRAGGQARNRLKAENIPSTSEPGPRYVFAEAPAITRGRHNKRERSLGRCLSSRSPAGPGCRRPPVLTPMPYRGKHPGDAMQAAACC